MINFDQSRLVNRFVELAAKIGNQVYLRSLRDAFASIMPIFILSGLAVLINNVVFPFLFSGKLLSDFQQWGVFVINGTLNIASLLITPMIAWFLSRNKNFSNPIAAVIISLSSLVIMMPMSVSMMPDGVSQNMNISKILAFVNTGSTGIFSGIIIGLLSTALFMRVSKIKTLNIDLGENIPPAVVQSFAVLIPTILSLSFFGVISAVLHVVFHTDMVSIINTMIQEPLRMINTSLIGTVFIYSLGNFLFTLGIHQSIVYSTILEPFLLINTNENMLAYANHQSIPHIINSVFVPTFGMIGGTGSTISLLIAVFIFSRQKASNQVAKLAFPPGLFNINEPVIFGFPIVFNLSLMIPFVLLPAIGILFAYFCTTLGIIDRCVVLIPWTTPPLISAWLATAGDWRAVVVQLIIIIFGVLFYMPFLKINDRIMQKNATL